jgi:hypothetical protein
VVFVVVNDIISNAIISNRVETNLSCSKCKKTENGGKGEQEEKGKERKGKEKFFLKKKLI